MSFIVKNTTFPTLLDLVAPHSCRGCGSIGSILCDCCKNNILKNRHNICPCCKKSNRTGKCKSCKNLPPTFTVDERSGLIDDLIHTYKYSSARSLAKPLASLLNSCLPKLSGEVIIVPLPTISPHIRERGFDHTYLLAKNLAKLHPSWHVQKLLLRENNSVQVGVDKAARSAQAKKAYSVNPKIRINQEATYLIIDDVWTTGASMLSAVKKLQQAGVSRIILGLLAVSRLEN